MGNPQIRGISDCGCCYTVGQLKVDAFLKCKLCISISHFRHNIADFEYSLQQLGFLRNTKTMITILQEGNSKYNTIYFSQISPFIVDSAHLQPSLYHKPKPWGQKIFHIIILCFEIVLFAPQCTTIIFGHHNTTLYYQQLRLATTLGQQNQCCQVKTTESLTPFGLMVIYGYVMAMLFNLF